MLRELKIVEKELEELSLELKELEQIENELQQTDTYLASLQENIEGKSGNLKLRIDESEEILQKLKQEKKKVKEEVIKMRKNSLGNDTNGKIQALHEILQEKNYENQSFMKEQESLNDVEDALKRAKEFSNSQFERKKRITFK